jgi:hypothetical protein
MPMLALTETRLAAFAALAPLTEADPFVHPTPVLSGDLPALMLSWDAPWLEWEGSNWFHASLVVWCITAWGDLTTMEHLVSFVIRRMKADPYGWGTPEVGAPVPAEWAAIPCTAATVTYRVASTENPDPEGA